MSSSDLPGRLRALAVVCMFAVLAGCNVRPLYGSMGPAAPTQGELAAIEIVSAGNRNEQVLRNALIYAFQRGGAAAPVRYRLKFITNLTKSSVAVEELSDVPAAYLVQMTASFSLSDSETGRTLMTGTSFANASYDFSNQRFANQRAAKEAEDRAAKVIADDIQIRIAAYFADKRT